MLIINLQFFPFRNQIYKENCTRNSPHTIRNSTIPIQKEDWKSKNKKEKQEKSPATAIPLYCLRQLFVSKLNVLCSFNCLQHNTNNFVDYQTKEPKKKKKHLGWLSVQQEDQKHGQFCSSFLFLFF